jgi:hypothetical protein
VQVVWHEPVLPAPSVTVSVIVKVCCEQGMPEHICGQQPNAPVPGELFTHAMLHAGPVQVGWHVL